jgi:hypothetical protein
MLFIYKGLLVEAIRQDNYTNKIIVEATWDKDEMSDEEVEKIKEELAEKVRKGVPFDSIMSY